MYFKTIQHIVYKQKSVDVRIPRYNRLQVKDSKQDFWKNVLCHQDHLFLNLNPETAVAVGKHCYPKLVKSVMSKPLGSVVFCEHHFSRGEHLERLWKGTVLRSFNAFSEYILRVTRINGNSFLFDDCSSINLFLKSHHKA